VKGARAQRPASPRLPEARNEVDVAFLQDDEVLDGVDLTGTVGTDLINGLEVGESRLRGVHGHGIEIRQLNLTDVVLDGCDLSGALVRGADLRRVEWRDCRISGLVLDASTLHDVVFRACKLDTASLRSIDTQRVVFEDCVLSDADLSGARLPHARFTRCDLRGARFAKADARGARLHGSLLDGLRDADALRGVRVGEEQIASLGLALFEALGIVVDEGLDDADGS
jgi:uncharacterized protein YjbI with pentapeptide repeats